MMAAVASELGCELPATSLRLDTWSEMASLVMCRRGRAGCICFLASVHSGPARLVLSADGAVLCRLHKVTDAGVSVAMTGAQEVAGATSLASATRSRLRTAAG